MSACLENLIAWCSVLGVFSVAGVYASSEGEGGIEAYTDDVGEEKGDPDRLFSLNVGVDGEEEFEWGGGDEGCILLSECGGGERRRSWMGKLELMERDGIVGRGWRRYRYKSGTCEMRITCSVVRFGVGTFLKHVRQWAAVSTCGVRQ